MHGLTESQTQPVCHRVDFCFGSLGLMKLTGVGASWSLRLKAAGLWRGPTEKQCTSPRSPLAAQYHPLVLLLQQPGKGEPMSRCTEAPRSTGNLDFRKSKLPSTHHLDSAPTPFTRHSFRDVISWGFSLLVYSIAILFHIHHGSGQELGRQSPRSVWKGGATLPHLGFPCQPAHRLKRSTTYSPVLLLPADETCADIRPLQRG